MGGYRLIYCFPKYGAGLESHHPARVNLNLFAGLGVPSSSRPLLADGEIPETVDFDFLSPLQVFGQDFKYKVLKFRRFMCAEIGFLTKKRSKFLLGYLGKAGQLPNIHLFSPDPWNRHHFFGKLQRKRECRTF